MKIKDIKRKNTSKILNALRNLQKISKKELSHIIGLSPSTLTDICSDLLKDNIIREVGEVVTDKPGRKKILIELNYDYKNIFSVDIKKERVYISLCNLKGSIIFQKRYDIDTSEPEYVIDFISYNLLSILEDLNLSKTNILGVGVNITGAVNSRTNSTLDFIGFWSKSIPLGDKLEEKLGLSVFVSNNVKSLATYQMFSTPDISDFFFLKYGTGVGGGLVVNGELFKKDSPLSGEVGHSIIKEDNKICPICKRKGCFEKNYSEPAILEKLTSIYSKEKTPILFSLTQGEIKNLNFNTILEGANLGELEILNIFRDSAKYLSIILLNTFTLFYPEKIILCGRIFTNNIFMNSLFSEIHSQQIVDFRDIISVSNITKDEERIASLYSVLQEKFYNNYN